MTSTPLRPAGGRTPRWTVADGTQSLAFTTVVNGATLSAIEVEPVGAPTWATTTQAYRSDGLRHSRTAAGVTTTYTWDVSAGLPVVLQDGANTYLYGLGGSLVSQTNGTGVQTYLLSDGLGSTRALTDASGSVTATYDYDAFGALRASTGTGATEYRFTGQQEDTALGYQYLRARYYDPTTGRFISKDPFPGLAAAPATLHPYVYSLNNPTNLTDPTGLFPGEELIERALSATASPAYSPAGDGQTGDLAGVVAQSEACGTGSALPAIDAALTAVLIAGMAVPGVGEVGAAANAPKVAGALRPILDISLHARRQMGERKITENMISAGLRKGTPFWDPKNGTINYILREGFASGKDLLVGQNPLSGLITTVIRGKDLVSKRMVPIK
jgi:RHS repeat-associated protein